MSDSGDRTGSRLGPYHLDMLYEDLDEPGGQLYAAHRVDTGRPALVLVPEPGDLWKPRSDLSVRVTAQASPPFLATELERPPPPDADALTEVDLALIRMAGGIASVEGLEEANVLFTQEPIMDGRSEAGLPGWRRVGTGALVAGALVVGALVLGPWLTGSPRKSVDSDPTPRAGPAAWIDRRDKTSAIGYPMPEVAYPEQAKPPCPRGYEEIRGGCWYQGKETAPCSELAAEYEGKCYVPLREKKPVPRSLEH